MNIVETMAQLQGEIAEAQAKVNAAVNDGLKACERIIEIRDELLLVQRHGRRSIRVVKRRGPYKPKATPVDATSNGHGGTRRAKTDRTVTAIDLLTFLSDGEKTTKAVKAYYGPKRWQTAQSQMGNQRQFRHTSRSNGIWAITKKGAEYLEEKSVNA
ncbi:MAG TPA: hypothetical protein VFG22_02000 [Polyangiales bacterium]|nr:hypothetical protein [Polyangiales bacterium]